MEKKIEITKNGDIGMQKPKRKKKKKKKRENSEKKKS
jgi:hypothetical protein